MHRKYFKKCDISSRLSALLKHLDRKAGGTSGARASAALANSLSVADIAPWARRPVQPAKSRPTN
jgi:hypothetical protein